ncbi:hypothetical protein GQX74_004551 [Glossina fuscipes]|nr:hypothetical protein GQX74_004551 [Glossina fuscipes]
MEQRMNQIKNCDSSVAVHVDAKFNKSLITSSTMSLGCPSKIIPSHLYNNIRAGYELGVYKNLTNPIQSQQIEPASLEAVTKTKAKEHKTATQTTTNFSTCIPFESCAPAVTMLFGCLVASFSIKKFFEYHFNWNFYKQHQEMLAQHYMSRLQLR